MALGLAKGDGVFVHSALSKIGHVIGGPRGLIEALLICVGENGLVGMPGFSTDAYDPADVLEIEIDPNIRDALRAQVPGFDTHRSSASGNGSVPETFRTWPNVVRSPHPTSSVLLWGDDAERLAAHHDATGWATGPQTPWGKLRHRPNMKILLIRVGWNRSSALHAAESMAPHRRIKQRHFKTGPADAPWINAPDVADDLGRLFPLVGSAFENTGKVSLGNVGQAESRLCGYDDLIVFASDWINTRNAADGVPAL